MSYASLVFDAKRRIVLDALKASGGNVSKAATALGLQRTNMYRLMRALDIEIVHPPLMFVTRRQTR